MYYRCSTNQFFLIKNQTNKKKKERKKEKVRRGERDIEIMTNLFSSFSLFYNLLFFFNFFSFFSNWGTELLQKYEYHHIGSALILFGKFLRGSLDLCLYLVLFPRNKKSDI